jgi:hypothetical protein
VGDEVAAEMGLLRIQAKDWLDEWKGNATNKQVAKVTEELPDYMRD